MVWKPCDHELVEWPVAEWSICNIYVIQWGGSCWLGLGMFCVMILTNTQLNPFSFFHFINLLWWYRSFVFSERSNCSQRNPDRLSCGFLELFSSSQLAWKWCSNFFWDHRTFWWHHIQQGWHMTSQYSYSVSK